MENNTYLQRIAAKSSQRKAFIIRFKMRRRNNIREDMPHQIYIRLRLNKVGLKSDITTKIKSYLCDWDSGKQRIRGGSNLIFEKNQQLEKIETDLIAIFNNLTRTGKFFNVETIGNIYKGKIQGDMFLLKFAAKFNELQTADLAKTTTKNHKYHLNKVAGYIKTVFNDDDLEIESIDTQWLGQYYLYCRREFGGSHYAKRQIQYITRVLRYAQGCGIIEKAPEMLIPIARQKAKPIKYLTENELDMIETNEFLDSRLQKVADAFLFCSYTGFAYNELLHFKPSEHIKKDKDGTEWIILRRGKSDSLCRIPILAKARRILEKYHYRIPVISNQKMNEYIKDVATVVGLDKPDELTIHIGRKTAGTYLLNKGVDILTVSKILGHSSTRVTEQTYAELLTDTIKDKVGFLL